MWTDRLSSPGPLALESDALPTALRDAQAVTDFTRPVTTCRAVYDGRCLCFREFELLIQYSSRRSIFGKKKRKENV